MIPVPLRSQDALPPPLDTGTIVDLNNALDDAFHDDLEDICRCRDVGGATRFERRVEDLEEMEDALSPERIRQGLLPEGVDIPVEPGDTPRSYLERVVRTWSYTVSYEPLRDRLRELRSNAEDLERVRENRGNPYNPDQPPPSVDREVEILRALRRALADCRADETVPPPPEERWDPHEGLLIDIPREGRVPDPPTEDGIRKALLYELRNLCCRLHGREAVGAWMGHATRGLDDAPPDVQRTARDYRDLLGELATTMDTRGFHDLVHVTTGLVRKRCDKEAFESFRAGLVIDLGEADGESAGALMPETDPGPPTPGPPPESADDVAEDAAEPGPPAPPTGFRHVTLGPEPSRHTPESNHVAEGPDASARVRDFFEEGREVPHVEDGVFTDRHLVAGEHASQYAAPELHVAEGADASTLKDEPPTPPEGQRHLVRGPGASSHVPEERHVAEGPEASGLSPGDGDPVGEDEEDADGDDPARGGDLVRNPGDYNPPEVADAPPARGVQRMIVELEGDASGPKAGPGGWEPGVPGRADPRIYLTSLGVSTGEAFRVHVVSDGPVELGDVVVGEPVALSGRERRRIEDRLRAEGAEGFLASGYCLEFERAVPPAGTLYRLAPPRVQSEHLPVRRVLAASRRLRDRGALEPDSDPARYFHTIRQWAIWTREQAFDEEGFEEAFVSRTRENFRSAGAEWNDEVEGAVRALVPNRWRDVRAILREAGL